MTVPTLRSWNLALALWLALAWHGGLHAWQQLLAVLGIALLWRRAPQPWRPTRAWVLALAAVAFWQWLFSVDSRLSLEQLAWFTALLFLVQTLRAEPTPPAKGLRWLAGLALLAGAALYARILWLSYTDPLKEWVGTELAAAATHWFFPNQNLLVLGLFVPAALLGLAWAYQRWSRGPLLLWLLSTVLISYCGSKGGLLALAAGGAWLLLRAYRAAANKRRPLLLLLLLAVTLGVSWRSPLAGLQRRSEANASAKTQDPFRFQRLRFWKASLSASALHPWLGWGQGAYAQAILSQDTGAELGERNPIARYRLALSHAHSEPLEMAVELGWPATLLLLGLGAAFFWRRWNTVEPEPAAWVLEAWLFAVAAHAMVDMPLRPPFLQLSYAMALAWLLPRREPKEGAAGPAYAAPLVLALAALLSAGALLHVGRHPERQRGLPQPSLEGLQRHLQQRPYDAIAWLQLAQEALARQDLGASLSAAERALALEPNFVDAWTLRLNLAKALRDAPQVRRAEAELKRIAALKLPEDQAQDPYCLRLLNRAPENP